MMEAIDIAGLIAAVVTFGALSSAIRTLERNAPSAASLPPITVIRPVRGLDPGLEENCRAALRQRYPGPMETLFVLDDASDPAFPVITRVIAEERSDARVVLAGEAPRARTGKLHAMIVGLAAARQRTELVAFADSDTRPEPGVIAELAATVLASPQIGAAFARVIGTEAPRTLGDVGYALLLDGIYGPEAALATRRQRPLPFVMGQTMVLRRRALDASGGLEGSEGQLVDDMHIGARLAAAGYQNVVSATPVAIVQHGLPFRELREIALRWMVFGRTGIPWWPFNLPAVVWIGIYSLGILGAVASILAWDAEGLLVAIATAASVVIAVDALRRQQGGAPLPWRLWWAPAVLFALVPWWFLQAHFARTIVWRGRTYSLDGAGRLGALTPSPPLRPPELLRLKSRSAS